MSELNAEHEERIFQACLKQLQTVPPAALTLPALALFQLIAQVQLALRHPGNVGPSANMARSVAEQLAEHFRPHPLVFALIERGWTE